MDNDLRLKLEEAEGRFRLLIEHSPSAMAMFDREMRYIAASRRWLDDYGITDPNIIGRLHYDIFPEIGERWKEVHRRALAGEVVCLDEEPFVRADGRVQWLRWEVRPWYAGDGVVGGIAIFTEDITFRKTTTRELRLARFCIDESAIGIFTVDENGFITSVNRRGCESLGYTENELCALTVFDIDPTFTRERWLKRREKVREEGSGTIESLHRRKDGSVFPVEITTTYLDFEGERFSFSFVRDITQRKSAEDALRESEEKFRILFRDHAAVKLILDPESGRIIDANNAAARFYGWSVDQLAGMNISEINILPPSELRREMEKVASGEKTSFEFKHRRADGSIVDVEVLTSSIKIGGRHYLHSIIHDITEKRRLEEQLRQAQKMESVGILAGGVAHDFNNILTVITGGVSLLRLKLAHFPEYLPLINQVLKSTEKAAGLTKSLLSFSRRQIVAPKPEDLVEIIDSTREFVQLMAGNVDVRFLLPPRKLPVFVDRGQVEQVITNLVSNARDAMPDGGTVTIEAGLVTLDVSESSRCGCLPGRYAVMSVSDTGAGMDEETRRNIYDPFFTTKPVGKGTGLGLAIVYGVVKEHDGVITVRSQPGEGTTFSVYFPAAAGNPEKDDVE